MERRFRITVDGKEYQVTVEDLTESAGQLYPHPNSMTLPSPQPAPSPAPAAAPAPRGQAGVGDVTSTLGGVVESLLVSVGQQVAQGDRVAVIEAMKMKTPMIAHRSGRVTAVAVKVGEAVDAGQTLVTLG